MVGKVLVTRAELPGDGLDRLAREAEVVRWSGTERPSAAELHELAPGVDGIVCLGNDVVDAALLDAAGPGLRVVGLVSMGYDRVDLAAAADRGVVVTHTPGVLSETTADLAFALILMARRRLGPAGESLRTGGWSAFRMHDYLGLDVHGATLGLVGYGEIGRAVARRAAGFGMRVLHHSRSAPTDPLSTRVDLPRLLGEADVVSLHVPLTPQTRHLIGEAELRLMKPTATLVNTSRGGVVDEAALRRALAAGVIHSAGLDVFEREPLGDLGAEIAGEGRLVALPHIGSATEATRAAMAGLAVDNVLDVLGGRPARTPVPVKVGSAHE
jgi:glyoxylate reductase